jgi:hypothetical protein
VARYGHPIESGLYDHAVRDVSGVDRRSGYSLVERGENLDTRLQSSHDTKSTSPWSNDEL